MSNLLSVILKSRVPVYPSKKLPYISCGTAFTQIISNILQLIRRIRDAGEQFAQHIRIGQRCQNPCTYLHLQRW